MNIKKFFTLILKSMIIYRAWFPICCLAKADNGLIVPSKEKVDLAQEVQLIIDFFEPLTDEKNVKIVSIGNASIIGDKLMMRRAISNLLSNSKGRNQ